MHIIRDLVWKPETSIKAPLPDPDPLSASDGFYEAILVDIYYVPLFATVLLLFDLRTSLMFSDTENTAVLICKEVAKFNIRAPKGHTIWNIGTSKFQFHKDSIQISFADLLIHRHMDISAGKTLYIEGFVDGIGECSKEIEMDNLTPYLQTTQNLDSQLQITAMSLRSVNN